MLRHLVLPAATLLACLVGTLAFFLWNAFHPQFGQARWPERAYAGDLAAQRHLASCYVGGCSGYVLEPVLACAWRSIIVEETKPASAGDLSAQHKACNGLAADDRVLNNAEASIHKRLGDAPHHSGTAKSS